LLDGEPDREGLVRARQRGLERTRQGTAAWYFQNMDSWKLFRTIRKENTGC